jgi:hypothetical protein
MKSYTKEKHIVLQLSLKNETFYHWKLDKALSKGGPDKFVVDPFEKKYQSKKWRREAVYNSAGITEVRTKAECSFLSICGDQLLYQRIWRLTK